MLRFRFCFVIVFVKSEMSRFLCWHILNSFECIYFFDFNWAVSVYTVNSLWQNYRTLFFSRLFWRSISEIMMKESKGDYMTPRLNELYWLPVKFRIEFKIATYVYWYWQRTTPPPLGARGLLDQGPPMSKNQNTVAQFARNSSHCFKADRGKTGLYRKTAPSKGLWETGKTWMNPQSLPSRSRNLTTSSPLMIRTKDRKCLENSVFLRGPAKIFKRRVGLSSVQSKLPVSQRKLSFSY